MEYQDYYATLGVPKTATEKEIRSAYRKLARQHHPDVNPGTRRPRIGSRRSTRRTGALRSGEAQEVRRGRATLARVRAVAAGPAGGGRTGAGAAIRLGAASVRRAPVVHATSTERSTKTTWRTCSAARARSRTSSRACSAARGRVAALERTGGRRPPRPRAGSDLEQPIDVTLEEAYRGTTRVIAISTPDGQTRRLEVTIPPGVDNGSRVRVSSQGQPGLNGGPAGDLYLVISVLPHARFERRGDDLHIRIDAPFTAMLLGGEVHVPTVDGRSLALTIPPATQDGRQFRLRNQGMPHLGRPEVHGDLHAEIHALLPGRLTERQRELMQEFASADTGTAAGTTDGVGAR